MGEMVLLSSSGHRGVAVFLGLNQWQRGMTGSRPVDLSLEGDGEEARPEVLGLSDSE